MKAVCVGDISIDWYVSQRRRFVGGISFNVAWNFHQLGFSAELISAVGNDAPGQEILEAMSAHGLKIDSLQQLEGPSACQRILLSENGERKFDGYTTGVIESIRLGAADRELLHSADVVHVPLSDGLESLFVEVAELDLPGLKAADFSIDFRGAEALHDHLQEHASHFDVLFLGGRESDLPFVAELAQGFPNAIFAVTLGGKGCSAFFGSENFNQPASLSDQVCDTTGCGDAFQAGFLTSLLQSERDIPLALIQGKAQADKVLGHIGSTTCEVSCGTNPRTAHTA